MKDINDKETLIRHICSIQYDSLCLEMAENLEIVVNYWDWNYCHDAICFVPFGIERSADADIYETAYPQLDADTWRLFAKHRPIIEKALSTVNTLKMSGDNPNIWSVDFMLEKNRCWLSDMAQGW